MRTKTTVPNPPPIPTTIAKVTITRVSEDQNLLFMDMIGFFNCSVRVSGFHYELHLEDKIIEKPKLFRKGFSYFNVKM